jgi:hypothetical protein
MVELGWRNEPELFVSGNKLPHQTDGGIIERQSKIFVDLYSF